MNESSTETKKYVHEGIEVIKTGRIAKKEQQSRTVGRRAPIVPQVIYEITPADPETGHWKKWVKETELYEIVEK